MAYHYLEHCTNTHKHDIIYAFVNTMLVMIYWAKTSRKIEYSSFVFFVSILVLLETATARQCIVHNFIVSLITTSWNVEVDGDREVEIA